MSYSPIAGVSEEVVRIAPTAAVFATHGGLTNRAAFEKAIAFLWAGQEVWSDHDLAAQQRDPATNRTLQAVSSDLGVKQLGTLRSYARCTLEASVFEALWPAALRGERVFTSEMVANFRSEKTARRRLVEVRSSEARQGPVAGGADKKKVSGKMPKPRRSVGQNGRSDTSFICNRIVQSRPAAVHRNRAKDRV